MGISTNDNVFLPQYTTFPSTDTQAAAFNTRLTQVYTATALSLNIREIARYYLTETQTGQKWFSGTTSASVSDFRGGFRTVYKTAAIVAPGTTTIAHGLTSIGTYALTDIYGTLFNNNTGAPLFIPLTQAAPDDVAITVDGTNINIIAATATYNTYSAIVVLEYVKQQ